MTIDPENMSIKGRARYLEQTLNETNELLEGRNILLDILGENVHNPVVHHGKHGNDDLNRAYEQYKRTMQTLKQNQFIIETLMKYDGRGGTAGDNNKKSTRLHTT